MNCKVFLLLTKLLLIVVIIGCNTSNDRIGDPVQRTKSDANYERQVTMTIDETKNYGATIRTNHGSIGIELFASQSPKTVNNFVTLSRDGFYDGIIFHRVIPNFMIQGGDPTGTGTGGPGYQFEDEFDSSLKFDRAGLLAMANSGPNTNGSQFFITTVPTPHLTGAHTIFGAVTEGQDIVDAISKAPTSSGDRPVDEIRIDGIDIDES